MIPRRLAAILLFLCLATSAWADYNTPGTGVNWNLDDLVAHSGGAVTGGAGAYDVHQSVLISPTDRIAVSPASTLTFLDSGGTVGVEVRGSLVAVGTASAPIVLRSASAVPGAWRGLDYNDTVAGSEFHLSHCEIAYATIAVDIVGAPVLVENCDLHDCLDRALDFSAAAGVVRSCRIRDNQKQTITMTLSSSPVIEDCVMENNNIQNSSPYPYVNIGLQGVNSPTIRRCTITGSGHQMSGGIAVWNSCSGVIEYNHIEGCGYGILCYQSAANPTIRGNSLVANNIHPDTVNWGFGIACNGNNAPIVAENEIRGHGYGVAAINGGHPNLGNLGNASTADDGRNRITNNVLGGQVYGFYNNTPLAQSAQGNWWGGDSQVEVENAIFHQPDNPALGLVDYAQWMVGASAGDFTPDPGGALLPTGILRDLRVGPTPFQSRAEITFTLEREASVRGMVLDASGRMIWQLDSAVLPAGPHALSWDGTDAAGRAQPRGVYFFRLEAGSETAGGRLLRIF